MKVRVIEAQGARVLQKGQSQDDTQVEADRLVTEEGMTDIPPFDHFDFIVG